MPVAAVTRTKARSFSRVGWAINGRMLPCSGMRREGRADPADVLERVHLERLLELDEAHRRRGFSRASFLAMWGRQLVRAPRPATRAPLPTVLKGELCVTFVG